MANLLELPNETLLRIFHHLPQSVKHPQPQADLLNLALTCKRLTPLAREVLCTAPILFLYKVDAFLDTLLKYPDLQSKVRSLTVESTTALGKWGRATPIPALDAEFISRCIDHVQTLDLDEEVKQEWTQHLGSNFEWLGNLLSLALTLLPDLSSLYLGGAAFCHLIFLRPILCDVQDAWMPMSRLDRIRIPPQLSAKLTVLELPTVFALYTPKQAGKYHRYPNNFPPFFPSYDISYWIMPLS